MSFLGAVSALVDAAISDAHNAAVVDSQYLQGTRAVWREQNNKKKKIRGGEKSWVRVLVYLPTTEKSLVNDLQNFFFTPPRNGSQVGVVAPIYSPGTNETLQDDDRRRPTTHEAKAR